MIEPGTWMSGTLRDEDMLYMFDSIAQVTECDDMKRYVKHARFMLSTLGEWDDESNPCVCDQCKRIKSDFNEGLSHDIQGLFDHVMNSHTPEGHYFGSIEGDGAHFGVWQMEEEGPYV